MSSRLKILTEDQKSTIVATYTETYSISDVMKNPALKGLGRVPIKRFLQEVNLYEGIDGPN